MGANSLFRAEKWLDALFPCRCNNCDDPVLDQLFCAVCRISLSPHQNDSSIPLWAAFEYKGTAKRVIQKAKFGPNERVAHALANHWAREVSDDRLQLPKEMLSADAVCFVPLHWRRRLTRGFDFPAVFARQLSRHLRLPLFDLLTSTRLDPPLSFHATKAQRESLTQGRYRVHEHIAQKKIILVDDVTTTGATLLAATQALTKEKHEVLCYALAKTPRLNGLPGSQK